MAWIGQSVGCAGVRIWLGGGGGWHTRVDQVQRRNGKRWLGGREERKLSGATRIIAVEWIERQ